MEKRTQDWTQVAEIELVYKPKVKPSQRPLVRDSKDAYSLLLSTWNHNTIALQEEFKVLLLNRASKALGLLPLAKGTKTGTVADAGLILAAAVRAAATGIILAHNHPSGSLKPSLGDVTMTQKLMIAAQYFNISIDDHIIVTTEGYYSFKDEGEI